MKHKDLQNKINEAFGGKKFVSNQRPSKRTDDPLQILKVKFASGELTRDEFEEKYSLLSEL